MKKKPNQFSKDTLETLSHGKDWKTKIKVTEFHKKLKSKCIFICVCVFQTLIHTLHKTQKRNKKRSHPSRKIIRLYSDIMDQHFWVPVTARAMQRITQAGFSQTHTHTHLFFFYFIFFYFPLQTTTNKKKKCECAKYNDV